MNKIVEALINHGSELDNAVTVLVAEFGDGAAAELKKIIHTADLMHRPNDRLFWLDVQEALELYGLAGHANGTAH